MIQYHLSQVYCRFRRLSEMDDTIFDDDVTEMMIGSRDRMKVEKELANQGFRDGISEGQEVKLQEGFNIGYETASRTVFEVAKLRGEISAALTLHHLQKVTLDADRAVTLETLAQEAGDLEKQCLKGGCIAKQHVDTFCHQVTKETKMEEKSTLSSESCDCPSYDFKASETSNSGQETCSHGNSTSAELSRKLEYIKNQLKNVLSG